MVKSCVTNSAMVGITNTAMVKSQAVQQTLQFTSDRFMAAWHLFLYSLYTLRAATVVSTSPAVLWALVSQNYTTWCYIHVHVHALPCLATSTKIMIVYF